MAARGGGRGEEHSAGLHEERGRAADVAAAAAAAAAGHMHQPYSLGSKPSKACFLALWGSLGRPSSARLETHPARASRHTIQRTTICMLPSFIWERVDT